MTTREKLEQAKARAKKSGRNVTTGDKKTKTTTAPSGWSITTGVQKKTLAPPKRKASPAPTAGKTIKYYGGKSTVADLGHNPTKSAISKATTALRAATATTKPKATKNTASAVPKVKVPQVGAPTTTPDTKSNTAGKIVALGVAAGTAVGAAALLKKGKKPVSVKVPKIKPPRPGGDPKQLRLPGAEPKLPASPKGLPGAEKKLPAPQKRLPAPPKAKGATWAERGIRGKTVDVSISKSTKVERSKATLSEAELKLLRSTSPTTTKVERSKATLSEAELKLLRSTSPTAVKVKTPAPVKLPERPMDSLRIAAMPSAPKGVAAPKVPTTLGAKVAETERRAKGKTPRPTQEASMTDAAQEARGKAAVLKAVSGKVSTGEAAVAVADMRRPSGSQADIIQRRNLQERREVNRRDQAARPKIADAAGEAPKRSTRRGKDQRRQSGIPEVEAPKPPKVEGPKLEKLPTPKPVAAPEPWAAHTPEPPKAPEVKAPKGVARVTAGGTEAKNIYKEAREAMRTGDAGKMEAVVGRLPKGTKKTAKYTQNLEAGIQAAGNRPPPETPAPKAPVASEAPVEAPKAPKAPVEAPKVGRLEGVPAPKAEIVQIDEARSLLERDLARARVTNVKLKAAEVEAPKPSAPAPDTALETTRAAAGNLRGVGVETPEPTQSQTDVAREKQFQKAKRAGYRQRQKQAIEGKGIMTIPTDPAEVTTEEAVVRQKKAERDLMDAEARASEGGRVKPKPAPKAVGAEDSRIAADIVGEEEVRLKTRIVDPGTAVNLETEHGGGRQRGTIGDLVAEDKAARGKRAQAVGAAADKARTIAASRNVTPEQSVNLERAIDAEYDRTLETYFDDIEAEAPKNQRGPRKPDARRMFLDSTIDADIELAEARGSAGPPAPSDRTTLDQKIAEVEKRMKAGGESIYKGEETLQRLKNLRDHAPQEPVKLKSTRVLPPLKAVRAERLAKGRPSVRAATREGGLAGQRAATAKRVSGEAGPPKVPDLTKPGVVPAGPTTPPAEPARYRAAVQPPPKSYAEMWSERISNWSKKAYEAQVKRLTSPALEVAGEKAKATGKAEARVKASKAGTLGKVGTTLGLATAAFAGLGAAEAYSAEMDPKKRVGKAKKQFKADLPEVGKGIAKFSAADIGVKRILPVAVGRVATALGANATRAAFARGAAASLGGLALAGYIGYHAMPYTGKKLAELAHVAVEAKKSSTAAKTEKAKSEAKYGTIERATATRKAKEAEKRRKAKEK